MAKEIEDIEISPVVHKQAIQNSKFCRSLAIVLLIAFIVAVILIISLFPLKTTEVKVVEYVDGTDNFVRVLSPGQDIQTNQILVDYFVKKYVKDRETWNKVDDNERWAYVFAVSSGKVFDEHKALFENPKSPYKRPGFKRAVEIVRCSYISKDIRQVEFKTFDTETVGRSVEQSDKSWVATLKVNFMDRTVEYKDKDLNPLNLIVEEYSIAPRKEKN